ncbi:MAG: UDP-N-acetylmuramoyl-L-alanine--D-glutamate ligase [Lachnospiraceae bacterium]|nr:UDP-N-acetylmuramoyl-L-alanine--D-glutamate ligase [Lachnospiraceae bacterium]
MELKDKKVLVYGCGKSGIGAAGLLADVGAVPILFDEKEDLDREKVLEAAGGADRASVLTGDLPDSRIAELDLAVLSPGVPTDLPNVCRLRDHGVPIWGEVELAYRVGRGSVCAITGTNGKTTTTSLVGALMRAAGRDTFVVGNIGNAYTGEALKTKDDSVVVAEISSFQLETIEEFRPHASAILNITEDHLNRHHTMEEYIRVKELVTKNQDSSDVCVLNYEDEVLRKFGEELCPASVCWFSSAHILDNGICLDGDEIVLREDGVSTPVIRTDELRLIGIHNYENVMAAVVLALSMGAELPVIQDALKKFSPVRHRIEYIAEKKGVIWYNDSKGTNPDAAIRGICAMSRPTFLIGGGYDKGSDYRPWIRSFGDRVKCLVLEGKTKDDIRAAALECGFPEEKIVMKNTMDEAMIYCSEHAEAGDAVLLSPACASWGEFPNYEVRGDRFREYVEQEI